MPHDTAIWSEQYRKTRAKEKSKCSRKPMTDEQRVRLARMYINVAAVAVYAFLIFLGLAVFARIL